MVRVETVGGMAGGCQGGRAWAGAAGGPRPVQGATRRDGALRADACHV